MAARTEAGTLEQFIYDGVPGTAVSNLTQNASFPTQPDLVLPFNLFTDVVESAPGGQNYGSWTRGWLQPPQTGHYTFWLAADDSAELWISTNAATYPGSSPMHRVAQVLAPTARGEYDRYLTQKSAALWLERGQEYAFSIHHKQGEGDGFFQVGWQVPDGTIQRPLPLQFVQPFVPQAFSGSGVNAPATTPPEIHTFFSGTRFDVVAGQPVVLAPGVEARPPVSYQWYRNGVPLDGETLPWLEWLPDYSQDYSANFTLVAASPTGFAISPDFQFTFVADPVNFLALQAETLGNPAGFNVTFSRPVRPDTATNAANYRVDHGVTVLGAEWQHGTNTQVVVVHTAPLQPDVPHRVTFQGIVAANVDPLPFGSQLVIRRGDGGIGVMTDVPPGPVLPLPCIGCPPTASTNLLMSFETPELRDGNRAVNVRGYLTPVETADYVFHLSASGITFLHLSGDESPANKQLIALEPEWHLARSWTSADRRAHTNSGSPLIAIHFPGVDPDLPVNQSEYTVGAIPLEAGRRYYLEASMPGGGGFNSIAVLMRKATDPLPPDGAPPLPGEQLAWLDSDFVRAPVAITQQPVGTSTLQGRPAEFDVRATGSPWLKPGWLRNGLPVADAEELTLTIPEAALRDHQARYSVRVRNAFSEALSAEATLSVVPDQAGPQLLRARGSQRGNDVYLAFNEPIRPDLGVSPFFYSVVAEDDGIPLDVLAVELWGDELNQRFSEVRLVTEPQMPGRRYVVTAQGQYDLHDNVNHGSTAAFSAWVLTPGFALYERYDGITGYSTTNLTGAPKYPHHPDAIAYLNDWETPHDVGDHYGARLSGLVVPPMNGEYQFYLTASDQAFMYLASESGPATMGHVASAWIWASYREWTPGRSGEREPPQPRPPQSMIAGEPRYLEALLKEESHTDYMVATWRAPGEAIPPNGSASRLTGNVIAAWANPDGLQFNILSEPQDQVVSEGDSVFFAVSVTASDADGRALSLFHQWQTNGVEVAGANSPVFTMNNVPPAADGLNCRCRIWAPGGSIVSRTVRLTVIHGESWVDAVASGVPALNQIVLSFREPLQAQSALNLANYSVDGLAIISAELLNFNRTVMLTTSSQEAGRHYTLNYQGLIDASIQGNVLPPGELSFTAWKEEAGWVRIERYEPLAASTVEALVNHPTFPHRPTAVEFLPRLEAEHAFPNAMHRGFRLSGRLRPPATGAYDFYLAASGQALLSLSTDESVDQLTPIAAEPEGQLLRDYAALPGRVGSPGNVFFPTVTTLPVNQSHHTVGLIPLDADREYAFEVLSVEDSPAHFVSVVMVPAGSPVPTVGTLGLDGRLVINFTNPDNRIEIEPTPPPYIFTSSGSPVTLSIHTRPGPQPVWWQWLQDGLGLTGETNATLTFMASPGLHGARFQCRLAGPGSVVVSAPTLIAVNHAPLELVRDEDFLSVRLPPLTVPAVLQRKASFGNSEDWIQVGTAAPGSGATAFIFPNGGAQHYFRIAP